MKTILKAAALVLAMTTAAHAQSWIIVITSNDALAYKPIPAIVDQNLYNSEGQCWYNKGQWEGILAAKGGNYTVWCANVPGLIATK